LPIRYKDVRHARKSKGLFLYCLQQLIVGKIFNDAGRRNAIRSISILSFYSGLFCADNIFAARRNKITMDNFFTIERRLIFFIEPAIVFYGSIVVSLPYTANHFAFFSPLSVLRALPIAKVCGSLGAKTLFRPLLLNCYAL